MMDALVEERKGALVRVRVTGAVIQIQRSASGMHV